MSLDDDSLIRRWYDRLSHPVSPRLLTDDTPESGRMEDFCRRLAALGERVRLAVAPAGKGDPPAIDVGSGIRFHAVPEGRELSPFLDALNPEPGIAPPPGAERFADISFPVHLSLYMAGPCPHCPAVVRDMTRLVRAGRSVSLAVIDAGLFPALAALDGVRSVPTLVFGDGIRWTGAIDTTQVAEVVAGSDPSLLPASALEQMLKSGEAAGLAALMARHGAVFPAFFDLLTHEDWSIRLGAMVASETLAGDAPDVAGGLVSPLLERLPAASDTVKGDILGVLGMVGGPDLEPRLRLLADDASPDVREAALEAIEAIAERARS